MWKLQAAKIIENGQSIPVEDFKYETFGECFENQSEAYEARADLMKSSSDKYIRAIEIQS